MQDAYIEHINKGDETFSAEGLAAMVREIFIIGAESESVLLRWIISSFRNGLDFTLFRWALRLLSCHPQVQVLQSYLLAFLPEMCFFSFF